MSSSRASTTLLAALALVTTGACGASQGSGGTTPGGDTRPAHVDGPPAGASNDNGPVTAEAQGLGAVDPSLVFGGGGDPSQLGGAAGAARDTEGQVLVPGPHFSPPVLQASGVAGGPVEGHSGPMACTGHYPPRPQHVLKIGRRIPMLRVMADGVDRDLTLAVRTPDGQWHCNDDSGDPGYGLNPAVDVSGASGEIEVYVGVFSEDASGAQYTLGVTEDPNRYGSSMRPGGLALPPPSLGMPEGMVVP
jgi:hypothetical protein